MKNFEGPSNGLTRYRSFIKIPKHILQKTVILKYFQNFILHQSFPGIASTSQKRNGSSVQGKFIKLSVWLGLHLSAVSVRIKTNTAATIGRAQQDISRAHAIKSKQAKNTVRADPNLHSLRYTTLLSYLFDRPISRPTNFSKGPSTWLHSCLEIPQMGPSDLRSGPSTALLRRQPRHGEVSVALVDENQ